MIKKSNTLTTAADVKKYRNLVLNAQKGIDPITKRPVVRPALDHAHDTQLVRGVLSSTVNVFLGVAERSYNRYIKHWCDVPLADILQGCAEYLRLQQHQVYHPKFIQKSCSLYMALTSSQRNRILESLGLPPCKNDKARKEAFKKYIRKGQMDYQEILDMFERIKTKEHP